MVVQLGVGMQVGMRVELQMGMRVGLKVGTQVAIQMGMQAGVQLGIAGEPVGKDDTQVDGETADTFNRFKEYGELRVPVNEFSNRGRHCG